jgi:sugar phosphate isomerase/epimerase
MMLALATDYNGWSKKTVVIKDTLRRIAKAGFSHVHWCHEGGGCYMYSVYEMLQIREWCDELGLKVKGVHAAEGDRDSGMKDYTSSNEYNRLAGVELVKNRVDLAYILDAEAIVLHFTLGEKTEEFREDQLQPAIRSFDELEPYCKAHKIKLCIEQPYGNTDLCYRIFDTICERYDKDYLGMCFDTGHAFKHCKEKCLDYAIRYIDRLSMIHIHDNRGERDEHDLPFSGGFDWEGFAPIVARSPYTLPILVESFFRKEGDDTPWLEKALELGNRFSAMVERYRS